jgi:hypothetical protein
LIILLRGDSGVDKGVIVRFKSRQQKHEVHLRGLEERGEICGGFWAGVSEEALWRWEGKVQEAVIQGIADPNAALIIYCQADGQAEAAGAGATIAPQAEDIPVG